MIRFFDSRDKDAVISIWQEAFGDKKEDVSLFLEFLKDSILVFEKDGRVVSMLTLLGVSIGIDKGRYVYAVATDKAFRKKGYAGELIEYAKRFIVQNNEKFLVLLPQEEKLYRFYKKYGFCELYCAENKSTKINLNETTTQKAEIITVIEYFTFRKTYFQNKKFVEWDIKTLEFMKNAYNGKFLIMRDGEKICGAAFSYTAKDRVVVAELLTLENQAENLKAIGAFYRMNKLDCICASQEGDRFAMIYPREYEDSYFGLGMK